MSKSTVKCKPLSYSLGQPLKQRDGSLSQQEWTARRPHIMSGSDTLFELVIQRRLRETDPKLPLQQELPGCL